MLTALEEKVLEMLLAGREPVLKILRDQLSKASVAGREFTGVGFFTCFKVSSDAPVLPRSMSFTISDVGASMSELELGAGFLLFVESGRIDMLEGYL